MLYNNQMNCALKSLVPARGCYSGKAVSAPAQRLGKAPAAGRLAGYSGLGARALLTAVLAAWACVSPAEVPSLPAADAESARERALQRVAYALEEVRVLSGQAPDPRKKRSCGLLKRPEKWLHVLGEAPQRRMSVAATVSAAADVFGWSWSHALPSDLLYMELDFAPTRRRMTGAEWLCAADRLTGGVLRFQMYPGSRHLFVGQRVFDDERL